MSRKQSVILTPTEKKIAVAEAKVELNEARKEFTALEKAQALSERVHAAAVRDLNRAHEAGNKERAKHLKAASERLRRAELAHVNLTVPTPAAAQLSAEAAKVV